MRIVVDRDLCTGHAMCNIAAPDLFPLSDDGAVAVTEADIPPGRERDAQTGSTFCPERAITITS